jgi:hypothetical protein
MPDIPLTAKTARAARAEISARWPHKPIPYTGYDINGLAVLISLIREKDNHAKVATATRNRSLPPVRFVAHITTEPCTCTFTSIGQPMDNTTCNIHTHPSYPCDSCNCINYRPSHEKKSNHPWPKCICGHIAQDHN